MISLRKLLLLPKVLLTVVILWMLYKNSELQFSLLSTFIKNPSSTFAIVGLCYVMVLFHTWRWYRLNSVQHIALPFSRTLLPAYMGLAFNNVLPGSVGGDFFRLYFILKKFPTQKSNAVLAIFVDRVTGLFAVLLMACIAATFYLDAFRQNTSLFYLLVSCFGICVAAIVTFMAIVILMSERVGLTGKLETRLQSMRYSAPILSLLRAVHIYRNSKRTIFETIIMSMATQIVLLIAIIIITATMGLPQLPVGVFILALVIGQIANLIPLTPGGLGVGEAAFANVIYLLHPGAAAYATVFFGLRLLSTLAYLPGVLIGIFAYDLLHKSTESSIVAPQETG